MCSLHINFSKTDAWQMVKLLLGMLQLMRVPGLKFQLHYLPTYTQETAGENSIIVSASLTQEIQIGFQVPGFNLSQSWLQQTF